MQPEVEITKRADGNFKATVGTGDGTHHYAREGLVSLAECLQDAASVLGDEFSYATVIYDRLRIGSYPVAVMEHRAFELADELMVKLSNRRAEGRAAPI
ncbi:hypothetical protein QTI33_22955 [Variovorax sp. J22P271]|uniref:hypothetical protein n=1 Tax=Variovorax davisae TaxID=3053515 RepID=UPI002578EE15|nr:hypothetical protein [Variovorax sp. J22P271]MDM0035012.1 hypothetical protein [Variovorax sp. J22P271]